MSKFASKIKAFAVTASRYKGNVTESKPCNYSTHHIDDELLDIPQFITKEEKDKERSAHLKTLKERASNFTSEEAELVVSVLCKKYPMIVTDMLGMELFNCHKTIDSIVKEVK